MRCALTKHYLKKCSNKRKSKTKIIHHLRCGSNIIYWLIMDFLIRKFFLWFKTFVLANNAVVYLIFFQFSDRLLWVGDIFVWQSLNIILATLRHHAPPYSLVKLVPVIWFCPWFKSKKVVEVLLQLIYNLLVSIIPIDVRIGTFFSISGLYWKIKFVWIKIKVKVRVKTYSYHETWNYFVFSFFLFM